MTQGPRTSIFILGINDYINWNTEVQSYEIHVVRSHSWWLEIVFKKTADILQKLFAASTNMALEKTFFYYSN